MPSSQAAPTSNLLVDALPYNNRLQLLASCETVELQQAEVLANAGDPIRHVYFPTGSYISIDSGSGLEVGLIGNEGMLGTPLLMGVEITSFHALVQGAGPALRMTLSSFFRELEQIPELRQELERYLDVLIIQLAQKVACNRFHVVEERLARLLLMIRDRRHADEFHITHELFSQLLGVRRVGVTKAAGALQKRKLISYSRGDIRILDAGGLEAVCCKCYQYDKETYDRIMNLQTPVARPQEIASSKYH